MAKQTFTTGSVLTATQMNNLQANDYNWTVSQKTASYVLVAADAGTRIEMNTASNTTVTVNTGLFTAGDTLFIQNIGSGNCVITAGTATVQKAASASLTLAQYQGGYLYFISTSNAVFFADAGFTSPLTTKGDLFTWDTGNARLPVGTNGQALLADSTAATGLKWGSVASSKNFSLLNSGGTSLTGATTVTYSGISGQDILYIMIDGASTVNIGSSIFLQINTDGGNNYDQYRMIWKANSSYAATNFVASSAVTQPNYALAVLGSNASCTASGVITINGGNTAGKKMITSMVGGDSDANSNWALWTGGVWNNTATITSVSLQSSSGNFDAGKFYVYGSA